MEYKVYKSKYKGKQIDDAISKIPQNTPAEDSVIVVGSTGTSTYKAVSEITKVYLHKVLLGVRFSHKYSFSFTSVCKEPFTSVAELCDYFTTYTCFGDVFVSAGEVSPCFDFDKL